MQYCYYNYDYEEIVVVVVVVRREWGWYIGKREVLSKAYKQQNKEQQPQYVVVKCITNTTYIIFYRPSQHYCYILL